MITASGYYEIKEFKDIPNIDFKAAMDEINKFDWEDGEKDENNESIADACLTFENKANDSISLVKLDDEFMINFYIHNKERSFFTFWKKDIFESVITNKNSDIEEIMNIYFNNQNNDQLFNQIKNWIEIKNP